MERLTLRGLASILGYKDTRSARRWCKNNGVVVLCDTGTKLRYVIRAQVEVAKLKALISELRITYGDTNWEEVFRSYVSKNPLAILKLTENNFPRGTNQTETITRGENEQRFLSELHSLLNS